MNIAEEKTGAESQEPKTHTTALVFLILAVAVICFLAYSWSGAIAEQIRLVDYTTPDTQAQQSTEEANLRELPANIPVDRNRVVNSESIQIEGSPAQVVVFESDETVTNLRRNFSGWLVEYNFEIVKERRGDMAASLAAVNGDENIIVLISHLDQSNLSKVEVINSTNS